MPLVDTSIHRGTAAWSAEPGNYRPLNVRDALSYLDQVKVSQRSAIQHSVCKNTAKVVSCLLDLWTVLWWPVVAPQTASASPSLL